MNVFLKLSLALGENKKKVQEIRKSHKDDAVKKSLQEYDENLERYIPILMAQASIYWEMQNYAAIEKIFRKSVEFCSDHDVWRLNVGHVLFMQDNNKYKDAIGFYEPIVKKHYDNVTNHSPRNSLNQEYKYQN